MKTKIGDRFKYKAINGPYWYEVIDFGHQNNIDVRIIKSSNPYFPINALISGYPDPNVVSSTGVDSDYIGNFSKSNNFKVIYEILNSSNDATGGI